MADEECLKFVTMEIRADRSRECIRSIPIGSRVYFDKGAATKGAKHCVTITMVIFSHVKITCCFHLSIYEAKKIFIDVYIIIPL